MVLEPIWGPSNQNKREPRRKQLGRPTATDLGPDRLLEEAVSNSNNSVHGGMAKQTPSFTLSFQEGPIQWMEFYSCLYLSGCSWLLDIGPVGSCGLLLKLLLPPLPPTPRLWNICYFPPPGCYHVSLDYCNLLSDFLALSSALWSTIPNPFFTMYPK